MKEFLGYERADGSAGIRNLVLILPATRVCNLMAQRIESAVVNTKALINTGEYGRTISDRERLFTFLTGIATNPNVAGIVLLGVQEGYGYAEFQLARMVAAITTGAPGKPLAVVETAAEGGMHRAIEKGIIEARRLVYETSQLKRKPLPVSLLSVGVKCGDSDATSGISGNPAFGRMTDMLVNRGGTVIFSETVEIIGAEHLLARRASSQAVADKLFAVVREAEELAASVGDDIRTVNPIPENIAAGISTLEEKSLGAICKSGSVPIEGVLDYCEKPRRPGLYFMDAWMSSYSLIASFAAAGCQMAFYQLGGQELPEIDPPLSAINPGVVIPMHTITGNPSTARKAFKDIDFSSASVLDGSMSLDEAGGALMDLACDTASGAFTRAETVAFSDPLDVYYQGPSV
jgi:altronate dehydratase large subunit